MKYLNLLGLSTCLVVKNWKASILFIVFIFLLQIQAWSQAAVPCPPNIDFSFGNFNNWFCYTGTSISGPSTAMSPSFGSVVYSGPVTNRHTITTGTATDPFGGFPIVAPGGGLFSVRVGNSNTGSEAERIRYYVHVPAGFNNYSFNFRYAIVLEDPDYGNNNPSTWSHQLYERPAYTVIGYDSATGSPLPCATQAYTVSPNLLSLGWSQSSTQNDVYYLPWTVGTLNLSGQGGKTIIVEVTTMDCIYGGHFGYGYFDILSCGQFNAAITYCDLSKGIITLTAPGGYANYKWYKGPTITGAPIYSGSANSVNQPAPNTPTFYYAVLTPYSSLGCPDTIRTRTISDFKINASPDTVCNSLGKPITLCITATGGLGGFNYSWLSGPTLSPASPALSLFGILSPSFPCNAIAAPTGSGFYVVKVSDSIGCIRRDTVIIQNPAFQLNLGYDITTCLGTPISPLTPSLTPPAPGYVFTWTGANVSTNLSNSTILNPIYTPTKVGWDTLILRVDSSVCARADTLRIRTLPNSFNTHDTAVCQYIQLTPGATLVTNADPTFTYTWSPSVGISTIAPSGLHNINALFTFDTSRTYTLTASYFGCPDIVRSINFRVEPQPLVSLGPDTVDKCFYTPLYLTAQVTPTWFPNYSFQWKTNKDLDNLNSAQVTFTGIKDTTLFVLVKTPLGCAYKDSIRVNVYEGNFGSVSPSDSAVCPHNPVTMTASGGVSYLWTPSLYLNTDTGKTVTSNPGASTSYIVYVKDKNGCVDTLPVHLQVYSTALLALPDSGTVYPGTPYQMSPSGNALYFSWFPTAGLSNPSISNPLASPTVNTLYFVTGTTQAGCTATDSIYIMANDETAINMPNAFSPGSAPNPEFKVSHLGTATLKSFTIYNRWGNKLFESTNIDKGWDGQFNGVPQPIGVYIYTIEAITAKGKIFSKQGNLTLLR